MSRRQFRIEKKQKLPVQGIFAQALQHHQAGRLIEAELLYQQVPVGNSRHADSLQMLGVVAQQTGRGDLAIDLIGRAIAINAQVAAYHSNLGKVLLEQGRLDEARASLHRALDLKPDYPEAHNNLGATLEAQGRPDEAAECYRRSISIGPDSPLPHMGLGKLLRKQGRLDEAVGHYRRALDLNPDYPEAQNSLGIALGGLGRAEEAVACYRRAIELEPDYSDAHNNLGNTLRAQWRTDEAVACYHRALTLKPDFPEAYINLGEVLAEFGHFDKAVACYRQALDLKPDYAKAYSSMGTVLLELGRIDEATAAYNTVLEITPKDLETHSIRLFNLNYLSEQSPESLRDTARQFGALASSQVGGRAFRSWRDAPSDRRLRVGLQSGNFCDHPASYFLENLLRAVDPARIEFLAFPSREQELTARFKPLFTVWEPIHALSDGAAAHLIHGHGVHVLLDLCGHTPYNRLPVFAWRPAPVQASWMGYLGTTGVAEMDYIIGDAGLLPPEEADHFTETAWRLPGFNGCFTPPAVAVEISPLPALSNNYVTFGCFNDLKKVNDSVVGVWARVLNAVPHSRLILKAGQLNAHAVCTDIRARFAAHGITADRLLLEPASHRTEYLRAYNRIDIALDPFPYPGGTTSFETLWMGVPVLTKKGNRFLAHGGEDIVHTAGLPDWIADDDDDYVTKAAHFASDIGRLATLRGRLRQQMLTSPLCDSPGFARQFEDAMWGMWNRWVEKKGPVH